DSSKPGEAPFQPTVAKYMDNYIILISSSKIFSYAGQRIGTIVISEKLFKTNSDELLKYYSSNNFGHALIYGAAYAVSAGVTHSSQCAFAAMLKAVNDDDYNFIKDVRVYGKRAANMKKIFTDNGFNIVYKEDEGEPIADGFYFTVSYPGMNGDSLIEELLYYGISAISLSNTGSTRSEGIRACVSLVSESQFPELERRLKLFHENHI
ncbi:MAG: aminotransferase class I/II-fold pyridoxal phosphate-dependent enzyme, partial [Ignavibacteria bacterium]